MARRAKMSALPMTTTQKEPENAVMRERKTKKAMTPPPRKPQPNLIHFSAESGSDSEGASSGNSQADFPGRVTCALIQERRRFRRTLHLGMSAVCAALPGLGGICEITQACGLGC